MPQVTFACATSAQYYLQKSSNEVKLQIVDGVLEMQCHKVSDLCAHGSIEHVCAANLAVQEDLRPRLNFGVTQLVCEDLHGQKRAALTRIFKWLNPARDDTRRGGHNGDRSKHVLQCSNNDGTKISGFLIRYKVKRSVHHQVILFASDGNIVREVADGFAAKMPPVRVALDVQTLVPDVRSKAQNTPLQSN